MGSRASYLVHSEGREREDANVAGYVLHLVVGAAAASLGFAPVRRSPPLSNPLELDRRGRGRSLYTPATLFASRIISALA
jgi:hypothetical protein